MKPGALDLALVVVFAALWPLVEHFWMWPRHVRAVAAGDPAARMRVYGRTLTEEWVLAAAVIALTLANGRPWSSLMFRVPEGWRLWLGAGLPLAYLVLIVVQGRALAAKPDAQVRLAGRLEPLKPLIPHTPEEYGLFLPLCVTAGFCEELLFRGYLVWVLQAWLGLWPAAMVSMVCFGLAHSYQGLQFGLRAFFAGVAMGLLALVTGSILPGMLLHALIDMGSGWVTYSAMRTAASRRASVPAVGAA